MDYRVEKYVSKPLARAAAVAVENLNDDKTAYISIVNNFIAIAFTLVRANKGSQVMFLKEFATCFGTEAFACASFVRNARVNRRRIAP